MEGFPLIPGYNIEEQIHKSHAWDVYLGIQEDLDRKVAIKILAPELFLDKSFTDRFLKETKKTAKFVHPNIINVLEAGESGGVYYIVMEYLPFNLRERINRQFSLDILSNVTPDLTTPYFPGYDELEPPDILHIIKQIAYALDYAHKENVIHKDITSNCIRFRVDGTPVISGFFMSKITGSPEAMKKKGFNLTSPQYISPEQALRKNLDASSDIYSLGIIFYEMLTGNVPYHSEEEIAIENMHIMDPIPKLPDSLSQYQGLLEKMMAKNKSDRFSSAAQLIQAIDETGVKFPSPKLQLEDEEEPILLLPEIPGEKNEKGKKTKSRPTQVDKKRSFQPSLLQRLLAPRVLIPLIGLVIILGTLAVFSFLSSSSSDTDSSNRTEKVFSPADIKYQRFFNAAHRLFNQGQYQKAMEKLNEAEKSKKTPELKKIKDQITAKLAVEKDNGAFSKAVASGEVEPLEAYLNEFPSGLHAKEAGEKLAQLKDRLQKETEEKKQKLASMSRFRSQYKSLTRDEVKAMQVRYGFFDKYYNASGKFTNDFKLVTVKKDKAVIDNATGLMWHQSGSSSPFGIKDAKKWLDDLNRATYMGYSDWRFPTLEELETLVKNTESKDNLFISSIFSEDQIYIWTGDTNVGTKMWAIDFFSGDVNPVEMKYRVFVRPVRSLTLDELK